MESVKICSNPNVLHVNGSVTTLIKDVHPDVGKCTLIGEVTSTSRLKDTLQNGKVFDFIFVDKSGSIKVTIFEPYSTGQYDIIRVSVSFQNF